MKRPRYVETDSEVYTLRTRMIESYIRHLLLRLALLRGNR